MPAFALVKLMRNPVCFENVVQISGVRPGLVFGARGDPEQFQEMVGFCWVIEKRAHVSRRLAGGSCGNAGAEDPKPGKLFEMGGSDSMSVRLPSRVRQANGFPGWL